MTYIPTNETTDGTAKVIYESKYGKTQKTLDAQDFQLGSADDYPIDPDYYTESWMNKKARSRFAYN